MQYDIIVIGAGILGLATAYQVKKKKQNFKILILDKENEIASHQTGHNSGVIHSGLYYKPGSLKAQNCLRGYGELLEFCDINDIAYDLCGKVVVATKKELIPLLDNLFSRGEKNGQKKKL